jgi:hypothetical protein
MAKETKRQLLGESLITFLTKVRVCRFSPAPHPTVRVVYTRASSFHYVLDASSSTRLRFWALESERHRGGVCVGWVHLFWRVRLFWWCLMQPLDDCEHSYG